MECGAVRQAEVEIVAGARVPALGVVSAAKPRSRIWLRFSPEFALRRWPGGEVREGLAVLLRFSPELAFRRWAR